MSVASSTAATVPSGGPSSDTSHVAIHNHDQFVTAVQRWVQYDDRLQILSKQTKSLRDERSALTPQMTSYMEKHNLHDNVIRIDDGVLKYSVETVRQGFTQRFLFEALTQFFENDHIQADRCMEFLKGKREQTRSVLLKRTYAADKC